MGLDACPASRKLCAVAGSTLAVAGRSGVLGADLAIVAGGSAELETAALAAPDLAPRADGEAGSAWATPLRAAFNASRPRTDSGSAQDGDACRYTSYTPMSRMYSTQARRPCSGKTSKPAPTQMLHRRGRDGFTGQGIGNFACDNLILRHTAGLHRFRYTQWRRPGLQLASATRRTLDQAVFVKRWIRRGCTYHRSAFRKPGFVSCLLRLSNQVMPSSLRGRCQWTHALHRGKLHLELP